MAKFILYVDTKREYRWHFKANNGQKIADSGEGYKNLSDCEKAIGFIKVNASVAPVVSLSGLSRN